MGATESVRFLFTLDLHERLESAEELEVCLEMLSTLKIPCTFFVPAILVEKNKKIRELLEWAVHRSGHEVGCHGRYHDHREDYTSDSLEAQTTNLTLAKKVMEEHIGDTVASFRAPAFRISATTFQALERAGYKADLSVCSQRLGFLSSQITNWRWMFAPRNPYNPSPYNPFRRGSMRLTAVPTTSFLVPFTAMAEQVLGLTAMKLLTLAFSAESQMRSGPVVYMGHPEEFRASSRTRPRYRFSVDSFVPGRTYGFPVRWALFERDEAKIYRDNNAFVQFLAGRFRFCTVRDYLVETGFGTALPIRGPGTPEFQTRSMRPS
jgi:hypothetical protein